MSPQPLVLTAKQDNELETSSPDASLNIVHAVRHTIDAAGLVRTIPPLIKHFEDIRTQLNIVPTLDDCDDILAHREARERSFDDALETFKLFFDRNRLLEHMSRRPINKDSFRYLKQVRQRGLLLRDLFRLFSASHKTPQWFHECMSALGSFNDSYWQNPSDAHKLVVEKNRLKIPFLLSLLMREIPKIT